MAAVQKNVYESIKILMAQFRSKYQKEKNICLNRKHFEHFGDLYQQEVNSFFTLGINSWIKEDYITQPDFSFRRLSACWAHRQIYMIWGPFHSEIMILF